MEVREEGDYIPISTLSPPEWLLHKNWHAATTAILMFHCLVRDKVIRLVILPKVQVAVTAKHTYTPASYLCGFEWSDNVNWCMGEWCTQNLRRNGSISHGTSHATTKECYQYTTSMEINNTRSKRLQSLIQSHLRHVRSESALEQRTALYKSYE